MAGSDHAVRMLVPPRPEHLRTVRLVAADTAGRAGLDCEQTDDLRIAIDELCHCLMDVVDGPIHLAFTSAAGCVTIEGSADAVAADAALLDTLSHAILWSVTEFFEIVVDPPAVRFTLIVQDQAPDQNRERAWR